MTGLIYLQDSCLKELDANILEIKDEKFIVLDKTIFYPQGGGQPFDTGKLISNNIEYNILSVKKNEGIIYHEVDKAGLKPGNQVHCILNWERRYTLMKMHTAAHLISALINKNENALITGNQLDIAKSRIDFSLENFDRELFNNLIQKANSLIIEDKKVKVYSSPREEAFKIPGIVKLASALPPNIPILRIVEIEGVDIQADGGTHVNSLKEIGAIEIISLENKGAKNRRVYFNLV